MTLEQINARLAEIRSMLDGGSADLDIDALTAEANRLIAERNRLMGAEQRRQEQRSEDKSLSRQGKKKKPYIPTRIKRAQKEQQKK